MHHPVLSRTLNCLVMGTTLTTYFESTTTPAIVRRPVYDNHGEVRSARDDTRRGFSRRGFSTHRYQLYLRPVPVWVSRQYIFSCVFGSARRISISEGMCRPQSLPPTTSSVEKRPLFHATLATIY